MKLNLKKALLIKRYKRFLADVILEDGTTTTIHVANTGAMSGCADEGDAIWYSTSDNPKRKYPFSWEYTQKPNGNLICVNTIRANQFAEQALLAKRFPTLANYEVLKREVKYGTENSKVDFLLSTQNQPDTYVEVKSVTLLQNTLGYFPDAVSTRGQKHLRELIEVCQQGERAVLLFAVLHAGITSVQAAVHIDKMYAHLLSQAQQAGVEILAFKASFTVTGQSISCQLNEAVPVII